MDLLLQCRYASAIPSITVNIRVLLLEQRHAKYHIKMGDISDKEVYCMAWLCSCAIVQSVPYAVRPW
jgi:hypothetical protein